MHILYADDDQLSLQIVWRALEARGHQVTTVDSSRVYQMLNQFQQVLGVEPVPQVIILDGHNLARDDKGNPVADVQPTMLRSWLQRQGLNDGTRFVLYSSDNQLVEQIRSDTALGFSAAVPKSGNGGGLLALLKAIET